MRTRVRTLYDIYTYKAIPHIGTRTVSKVCIFDFIRMYYYYYYDRHACNITNNYTNVCGGGRQLRLRII